MAASHHLPPPTFTFEDRDVEEDATTPTDDVLDPEYSDPDSVDTWEDDLSAEEEEDEENDQQNSRHLGFLMTCLSPVMDVIAVWRYPYIAYKHGGIVMFPWLILHFLIGLPLTYLEMTLGQVHGGSGGGSSALASMVPLFKGVTYSTLALLVLESLYDMTVITWCLFYLFTSMQEKLPWSQCSRNASESAGCSSQASLLALCNGSLTNCTNFGTNSSSLELPIARSEHYFNEVMLSASDGLQLVGPLSWKLCLCLVCAWFFVYIDVRKGKLPIRKKCILPTLVMTIVLCVMMGKATGQEGFQNGVRIYFSYEWRKLQDFRMWADVSTHIVLTMGLGTGLLQILGRRSHLLMDLRPDAVTVVSGNVVVSFFGGLVAFACLGYLATQLESPYVKFLREEFGAAFVVFSAALTELPGAVVWAIFFFAILVLVSLKRQRLLVLALASTLQDILRSSAAKQYRSFYILLVCGFMLGFGFVFVMPVGSHILFILDLYVIGWPALFICLMECIGVAWIYGAKRFCGDVRRLLQIKISRFWRIMWCIVTPTSIVVVLLFTILFDDPVEYNGVEFTLQARVIGWSLVTVVVGPTLIYTASKAISQRLRARKKQTEAEASTPNGTPGHPAKPHWHVLSQRRKGSITPAPKILVVKADEAAEERIHIPYGFVLTPQKEKTPRAASHLLTSHITELLNTPSKSCSTLSPSPCFGRKAIPATMTTTSTGCHIKSTKGLVIPSPTPQPRSPQMRHKSPIPRNKVAPLILSTPVLTADVPHVHVVIVGDSFDSTDSTELQNTSSAFLTPEAAEQHSSRDISVI